MGCTADGVLEEAAGWLGWAEDGTDITPFGEEWGYPTGEWCGMFCQSMITAQGGTIGNTPQDTCPHTHYTVTGVEAFKALGRWHDTPQKGDLVYIRWGDYGDPVHHVGLVEEDHWDEGYVITIEGNISEAVGRFTRYESSGVIVGFGRPAYASVTVSEGVVEPAGDLAHTNAAIVYRWLVEQGLSAAGAAGVLGNLQQESNIDPEAIEGGIIIPGIQEGVGIAQWSFIRRTELWEYADEQGIPWQDLNLQLSFLLKEVTSRIAFQAMWNRLKVEQDPAAAARDFGIVFEGYGVEGSRVDYALEHYENIIAGRYESGGQPVEVKHTRVVPFISEGEETMLLIDVVDGANSRTFGVIGGVLFPIDAPEIGVKEGSWNRISMQPGVFRAFYSRYVWANRLNLDLTPQAA